MKITKYEWENPKDIQNTQLPEFKQEDLDLLEYWVPNKMKGKISGKDLLSKILTLAGDYEFILNKYSKITDNTLTGTYSSTKNSIELTTTDNRTIKLNFEFESPQTDPHIIITDGNIQDRYILLTSVCSDEFVLMPQHTIELDTGFEQDYYTYSDTFSKPIGKGILEVEIRINNASDDEFHFVDDTIKELFKSPEVIDIMDVYHILNDNLPPELNNYHIRYAVGQRRLDYIFICYGYVREVEFTKEINKNLTTIRLCPQEQPDYTGFYDIVAQINDIQQTQEMKRSLKPNTTEEQ